MAVLVTSDPLVWLGYELWSERPVLAKETVPNTASAQLM